MGNDFRATCFVCNKAPITAAVMGENIATDTPCSTQCLGDRQTDRLTVLNIRADIRQPKIPVIKTDSKLPISPIFTGTRYFAHFLYQTFGCIKYTKYYFSRCNLVLFMEVRERDNTACNMLLDTFYSGHVETVDMFKIL